MQNNLLEANQALHYLLYKDTTLFQEKSVKLKPLKPLEIDKLDKTLEKCYVILRYHDRQRKIIYIYSFMPVGRSLLTRIRIAHG